MLKAIETVYKGYRFRSRLEARWAVFFDTLGVPFEYEPEGYDLDGLWYLPDFSLVQPGWMYVEIKGQTPTPVEIEKARRLTEKSGTNVAIFVGDPYFRCPYSLFSRGMSGVTEDIVDDAYRGVELPATPNGSGFWEPGVIAWSMQEIEGGQAAFSLRRIVAYADRYLFYHQRLIQAYHAARSARFGR